MFGKVKNQLSSVKFLFVYKLCDPQYYWTTQNIFLGFFIISNKSSIFWNNFQFSKLIKKPSIFSHKASKIPKKGFKKCFAMQLCDLICPKVKNHFSRQVRKNSAHRCIRGHSNNTWHFFGLLYFYHFFKVPFTNDY